jgi:hypothetical protein
MVTTPLLHEQAGHGPADRAAWYPAPAPGLEGEDDGAYTDRLTGADGTGRSPYDHDRNRQCSIGWHSECSDPAGAECKCPHHFETDVPAGLLTPAALAAAEVIAGLYDLPAATGRRVLAITVPFITAEGTVPDRAGLGAAISAAYKSPVTEGFADDVAAVTGHVLQVAAGLLLASGSQPGAHAIRAALEAERAARQ